jgi:Mg2+-importing ATPase
MLSIPTTFWSMPPETVAHQLESPAEGLTAAEADRRVELFGFNRLRPKKRSGTLGLLAAQFKSPIIITLLLAAGLSFFLHDPIDALIIIVIVLISSLLGFWQERGAADAVAKLLAVVQNKAVVQRDGRREEVPFDAVVPGDVTILAAGASVPGDCLILASKDLHLNEAALTGETFPVEKLPGTLPPETPLAHRTNALFMGTHVVSGTGQALVVHTGTRTEFGKVSERLRLRPSETEFERGIRRFGFFLMEVTLILVIAIFAANVLLARPFLDAFLFSLAIAVGLTPQLLPAVISVNLAHGARRMAREKVIVRRLASIENFGSMTMLCSDKTGTLTEGVVRIHSAVDVHGNSDETVLFHAFLNAFYESGYANPVDEAIRSHQSFDLSTYPKIDEIPYDFVRKRLSILVSNNGRRLMVTKGALQNVLAVCNAARGGDGRTLPLADIRNALQKRYEEFSAQGLRTLGIACKELDERLTAITREDEADMTFLGFLVLFDPPKAAVEGTIRELKTLGVHFKVITGDNQLVAAALGRQIGLAGWQILTGPALRLMSDEALIRRVNQVDVFAEIEPNQKERIIVALKKAGNVVGYIGDGINDASALHAADVGLSVDGAVDVAKEAADIVLMEKDLGVLVKGVLEGRKTFANTLKYVFMATSANFGNMFSMAGASLFLPFLPLLPKQILLTNLLTDFPEMTISTDSVDAVMMAKPHRWNVAFIRRFMVVFGLLSSVFDYCTFGILILVLHASPEQFRTGWFIESVVSAALIVLVIRTRRPFFESKPGNVLLTATLVIVSLTCWLPFSPLASLFGFVPLPPAYVAAMMAVAAAYIVAAEWTKTFFTVT